MIAMSFCLSVCFVRLSVANGYWYYAYRFVFIIIIIIIIHACMNEAAALWSSIIIIIKQENNEWRIVKD